MVMRYCEQVNKVAVIIAKALKKKNISVDIDAIDRATLLHDMARAIDFKSFDPKTTDIPIYLELYKKFGKIDHPRAAAEILAVEGYPELGKLAEIHRFSDLPRLKSWEEKIIYYADERVSHDKIVSLQHRFDDLSTRYPQEIKLYSRLRKKLLQLEKEIFNKLSIKPDDIR